MNVEAWAHMQRIEARCREERQMDNLAREVEALEAHERFERDLFGPAVTVSFCAAGVGVLLMLAWAHYAGVLHFGALSVLWWAER